MRLADLPRELRCPIERGGWHPRTLLGQIIRDCLPWLPADLARELVERIRAAVVVESSLALVHLHGPASDRPFRRDDYGIVGRKVVTDAGVAFIVDAFQNTTELENFKYHGLGTGGTAEAASQTALVTEITTEYSTNNTRPTGTTEEGATGNIYKSVATITVDASVAATEHGIFSQAATGGGTMLDRTLFSVVNLANGDSLQATYQLTLTSGG